jgi:hypothetical protein
VTADRLPDYLCRVFESKQVEDSCGNLRRLDSNISESEATDLFKTVRRLAPLQSVEIGLAHGISASAILAAILANGSGHHHIIDPFQQNYGNTGMTMIGRAEYFSKFTFYEQFAEQVIPSLPSLQFAFIDSSHLFDLTISEFVLIDKKLEVGGLIAFHDLWMPSIQTVVRYILSNREYEICRDLTDQDCKVSIQNRFREIMAQEFSKFPMLRRLLSPNALKPWSVFRTGNLIFLRKLKIDDRDWRFHQRF